ncbi:transcriptional regulator [Companilactobacillus kimchii]|nr:transcriptional regulator [Companilactobacillus kimchii]KAE9561037.1 transcriptional regulator [Companilactobacillus kimchii]
MTITEIRHFIDLCMQGDVTLMDRYELLEKEAATVKEQIQTLQDQLDFLHYKMWYFKTSVEAETEDIHMVPSGDGRRVAPDIHEQYREALEKCHDLSELIEIERDERKQANG